MLLKELSVSETHSCADEGKLDSEYKTDLVIIDFVCRYDSR